MTAQWYKAVLLKNMVNSYEKIFESRLLLSLTPRRGQLTRQFIYYTNLRISSLVNPWKIDMILGPLDADFIPSPSEVSEHQKSFQVIITALSQNLGVEPSFRAVSAALGNLADPPYTAKDSASLTTMLSNIRITEELLRKENEKSSSELMFLALNQLITETQTQLSQIGETISRVKIQKENRQNLNTLNPATFSQKGLREADLEASRNMAGVPSTEEDQPFSFTWVCGLLHKRDGVCSLIH